MPQRSPKIIQHSNAAETRYSRHYRYSDKMYTKIVFAFLIVCALVASTPMHISVETPAEITIVYLEAPCVRQGGICMHEDDCEPQQRVSIKGLCPKQRHLGAECCYEQF